MRNNSKNVEIIGPPGAGKSSLAQILSNEKIFELINSAPYFRRVRDLPFFILNSILMIKTVLYFFVNKSGRWFTSEELAWMVILNGWNFKIKLRSWISRKTCIIDEGYIFHLAYFYYRGPEFLKEPVSEVWWRRMFTKVTNTTDIIVWLDAPDEILLRRIRNRNNNLFVTKTDNQVLEFLRSLRNSYLFLLSKILDQKRDILLLKFDTQKTTLDLIARKVFESISN